MGKTLADIEVPYKVTSLHQDIHGLVAEIVEELGSVNHQIVEYGPLPSMLHAHMMCHALAKNTALYVEIDGREYPVSGTRRRRVGLKQDDGLVLLT